MVRQNLEVGSKKWLEPTKKAGTVGILNTHVFADGGLARLAAVRSRKQSDPNPFLIGAEATGRYYRILHECLQAALLRPQVATDWSKRASRRRGDGSRTIAPCPRAASAESSVLDDR